MSQPIISVENLSKSYLIGHQGPRERYTSLRDTLSKQVKNFTRRTVDTLRGKQMLQGDSVEEFWALKDVSFEVQQGEVLGIIGRNGAGKSTLLKVLSRITEPTKGKVTLRGRVASLLEVGTGFHPELSGRENIYLNGAILGMSRREIKAKFDEIIDFAGVEKFLDTPVKRYSSGMYVRLAFSVAAHLEPEILVVDEVLAVGDVEFQKKCMGKMQDVSESGRTVIFVSHNMAAIEKLCPKSLYLKSGKCLGLNVTKKTIDNYINEGQIEHVELSSNSRRSGNGNIRLRQLKFRNGDGKLADIIQSGGKMIIEFVCENVSKVAISRVSLGYSISTDRGGSLAVHYSDYDGATWTLEPGLTVLQTVVDAIPLSTGSYDIGCRILANGTEEDWPEYAIARLQIEGGNYGGNAIAPHSGRGSLLLLNDWKKQ